MDNRLKIAQNIIDTIPPNAGLLAQHRYTYYVAKRPYFFMGDISKSLNLPSHKSPDNFLKNYLGNYYHKANYIFVDLVSDQPCHPIAFYCYASSKEDIEKRRTGVLNLLNEGKWKLVVNEEGLILMTKK